MEREEHFLGRYAGSHWFNGIVAIILICLFSLWLTDALLDAESAAEKMTVEGTVRNMRTALVVAMGEAIIAGRQHEVGVLVGANPVNWLGAPPTGYVGDCPRDGAKSLAPGNWCFDSRQRQLNYRVRHERKFRLLDDRSGSGAKVLSWQVVPTAQGATNGAFGGASVQLVTPYMWRLE